MKIDTHNSLKALIFSIVLILIGAIITIGTTEYINHVTGRRGAKSISIPKVDELSKLPDAPFIKTEKQVEQGTMISGVPEGFLPPVRSDAPIPHESKKANNVIDNLLFAMSFFYRVMENDELMTSVVGWDPETGYYLPDEASPSMALVRNARYLLILKYYQDLYPTTKYFDEDVARIERILKNQIADEHIERLLAGPTATLQQMPEKVVYDLLKLSTMTGDQSYRKAALTIGTKLANSVYYQAALIKSNRDRTDQISLFSDAALAYIVGSEMGNLNLMDDSRIVIDELLKELWAERYKLFYTSSAIGQVSNLTDTFITRDQMHALVSLVRYADATKDKELAERIHGILLTMATGNNPICDLQRFGFFRRYNGKSETPHADYKSTEDHITYLEAWIRLNMMMNGEYEQVLNTEYDGYEMFLYDDYHNGIFLSYALDWETRPEVSGKPFISADAILDYLLMTLEDREFVAQKAIRG